MPSSHYTALGGAAFCQYGLLNHSRRTFVSIGYSHQPDHVDAEPRILRSTTAIAMFHVKQILTQYPVGSNPKVLPARGTFFSSCADWRAITIRHLHFLPLTRRVLPEDPHSLGCGFPAAITDDSSTGHRLHGSLKSGPSLAKA